MYSFQKPVLSALIGLLISVHPVRNRKTETIPIKSNIRFFNQIFLLEYYKYE